MFFFRVPLPTMVFQWFCNPLTITIECFFEDWPLTSMVFQWFSPNLGTMVNDGFGYENTKKMRKFNISHFTTDFKPDNYAWQGSNIYSYRNIWHLSKQYIFKLCFSQFIFSVYFGSSQTLTSWLLLSLVVVVVLLPLKMFNGFQRHHHHWMEWSEATIENNGFSMVLGQPTIGNDGFSMVGHHWSNDGMVTYHRWSLPAAQQMFVLQNSNW